MPRSAIDRNTGEFIGLKETVFHNVLDRIDVKTGDVTYRPDIANAKVGELVSACPTSAGRNSRHFMSHNPALLEGGGNAAPRRFFGMPGTNGNLCTVAAFDVKTLKDVWIVDGRRTSPSQRPTAARARGSRRRS